MNRTMITSTNTLSQLQKQMDMISHNLANIDTAAISAAKHLLLTCWCRNTRISLIMRLSRRTG
ncbi:flagellar basal body protein [Mesobacillus boroniphilus]|uniref:flagellar basal body protein n=1 Tax=Mesobacillus boroniphilus TaxID=308892 RepID=UPI0034E2048A